MNLAAIHQALSAIPDGSLVPIAWVRELIDAHDAEDRLGDYDVNETARILSRGPSTIRGWIRSGQLEAYRMGREWRVTAAAIRKLREAEARPVATASRAHRSDEDVDLGSWRKHYRRS